MKKFMINTHSEEHSSSRKDCFSYLIGKGLFLLAFSSALSTNMWAQTTATTNVQNATQNFTGKVCDSKDGSSLIGCTVRVKGKKAATITDANGNYSITANPGDILIISYIGYETIEVPAGSKKASNIFMVDNNVIMDDIVVTGYQTLKKFNVTGSVNTINNEKISLRSSTGLNGLLEGVVPGLNVYNDNFRIRGGASMNSGNDPLFIVDDFEVEKLPENMDMVESITILKDAAATAIWGSRAANGVIVITTKKEKQTTSKFLIRIISKCLPNPISTICIVLPVNRLLITIEKHNCTDTIL